MEGHNLTWLDNNILPAEIAPRKGIALSATSEFITDLIKAANAVEKQTDFERKRLLENAIIIIRHLGEPMNSAVRDRAQDVTIELQAISAAVTIGWASDSQVRTALLDAASMIRHLKVALDEHAAR